MIDVREHINVENTEMETIVKSRDVDVRSAFTRLDRLVASLDGLKKTVNETDVENTSDAWHKAYATLTKAFKDCMAEEKEIIARW